MVIRDLLIGAVLGLVILALASAALIEPQEPALPDSHAACSSQAPTDGRGNCRVSLLHQGLAA